MEVKFTDSTRVECFSLFSFVEDSHGKNESSRFNPPILGSDGEKARRASSIPRAFTKIG
jgi:hypothetical protein